jgi:cytochrome c
MAQDIGAQLKLSRRGWRARAFSAALALALAWLWPRAPAAAQQGNAADGAEVFKKCRACHDVGPEAKNKVGPMLNDIIGRTAGTVPQFAYSEANKTAGANGLTWSEESLAKYLWDPRAFMPGTKMAFAGLKDPQDRNDLIAYLKTFAKK